MIRGRVPKPTALRRATGNPGKRGYNAAEPVPPDGLPDCPVHLSDEARAEWDRLAGVLHGIGVVTIVDRACLAAYCQAWGRWVEAEDRLAAGPALLKTPSGYVQQSPWLSIANKQMELMGRYMTELGITPAARSRVQANLQPVAAPTIRHIQIVGVAANAARAPVDGHKAPPQIGHSEPDGAEGRQSRPAA